MIANLEPERPPGKRVTPYQDTARQHDSHWTLRLAIYSPPPCGSLRVPLPHSRTVSYTPEPRPTGRLRYQEAESVLPANVRGPGAERQFSKPDASFSDRALVRQRAKPPASSSARGRKWADFDHLPCARWSFCYHLVLVRGRYERFLTRFGGTVDAKWPPPAVTLVTFPPARRVRPVGWAFLSQTARDRWSETYHCAPIVVTWLPLCCVATTYLCPPGTTATPVMLYTQRLPLGDDVPLDAVYGSHRVGLDGEFAAGQALHVARKEVHHIGRAGHRWDR